MSRIILASPKFSYGPLSIAIPLLLIPSGAVYGMIGGALATAASAYYFTRSPEERRKIRDAVQGMIAGIKGALPSRQAKRHHAPEIG